MSDATTHLKDAARAWMAGAAADLIQLSHTIHADPELAFDEHRAAARLTGELEAAGFRVDRGVGGLPTAFRAELGQGGPVVAICAEYDALPEIGHACGHNIIASAAIGAARAVAAAGWQGPGTLAIVGTPAEEGGGGKVILLDRGAFDGIDTAMMIHPGTRNFVDRGSLASVRLEAVYTGTEGLADGPPGSTVSALDPVVQLFAAINALRRDLRPDARIHGIISEGGTTPFIVPGHCVARFTLRSNDRRYVATLLDRVTAIAQAAALATGTTLALEVKRGYENMAPNQAIAQAFGANLTSTGRTVQPTTGQERMGSTDMGNVSQAMPAIHAYIQIAEVGVSGHSVAFREAACSDRGDAAVIDAATALALTAIDLLTDADLLAATKAEFSEALATGRVRGPG